MVTYIEPERVDAEIAEVMLDIVEKEGPLKPWTLVSRVNDQTEFEGDVRLDVLKPLILKGVLTPNANGNIRIMNKSRLSTIIEE